MIDQKSIQETAFKIVHDIGMVPLEVDNGVTLNFEYSKAIAIKCVNLLIHEQDMWQNGQDNPFKYWKKVKVEIEAMQL